MSSKKLVIIILLVATCLCCVLLQQSIVDHYSYTMNEESLTYLPAQQSIKPFLLGYETAIANYLWIRTVIYYGHHYLTDKSYVYLERMLDIISKLNPYFYPVYEFGGLLIPELTGNIDVARILLDRGIYYLGDRKYNPAFYMGMIYYRYYHNPELAAHYFMIALHAKNAPVEKLTQLTAAILSREHGNIGSIDMLKILYYTSDNPEVKRYLEENIKKIYAKQMRSSVVLEKK